MTVWIAAAFPIVFLVLAAILEHQRDPRSLRNPGRGIPLAIALGAAILLAVPQHLYLPLTASSLLLSKTMAVTCAAIAACGIFGRFKSRLAATLVVLAGMSLTSMTGRTR